MLVAVIKGMQAGELAPTKSSSCCLVLCRLMVNLCNECKVVVYVQCRTVVCDLLRYKFGVRIFNVMLALVCETDSTIAGGPIGGQTNVTVRNEHLSYIITW